LIESAEYRNLQQLALIDTYRPPKFVDFRRHFWPRLLFLRTQAKKALPGPPSLKNNNPHVTFFVGLLSPCAKRHLKDFAELFTKSDPPEAFFPFSLSQSLFDIFL
jgi:hypothetical protein